MRLFPDAATRDAVILLAFSLVAFALLRHIDAHEMLDDFFRKYEDWQADDLFLGLLTTGLLGFVYAWRRLADLKREALKRNKAEGYAEWLAYHDPLTRLPNRHFLEARLADGDWGLSLVGSVIAIDLDGFKKVNDLVGHHGGDELLVAVGRRLSESFPDNVAIRLGGDEFLLVTPRTGSSAKALCEEIVQVLSNPLVIADLQVEVGASVGLAACGGKLGVEAAMQQADLALYAAKRQGRNSVCTYDPSLQNALAERIDLERSLRKAISSGSIRAHYQPLVDMQTGAVRGFEALARWTLDDGTAVPPSVFIELAEEAGLITELSGQLLRQACLDARTWPADTYLAFNLSPTQLSDRLLGLRIIRILMDTGLPARRLELEVTESAVVRDLGAAMAIIGQLREAGIRIAIDDFGTGFSSLSQLANIPFDRIKIDRSFVNSFEGNEKQAKIVKSIVGLGQGLGVETTAEGIELASQYEHLKLLGCSNGQGYLFGKAMQASDVVTFIENALPHRECA